MRSIKAPWEVSQDRPDTEEGVIRRLLEKHPLYRPEQNIFYREQISSPYREDVEVPLLVETGFLNCDPKDYPVKKHIFIHWSKNHNDHYFDAQISPCGHPLAPVKTFFVLNVEIEPENRGKGWGLMLYQILEQIAQEFGCNNIQMTASGWTNTGEKRSDYLSRKLGYKILNSRSSVHEVQKDIQQ